MGRQQRPKSEEPEAENRKTLFNDVRSLAKILRQHDLSEVEIETTEARIRVSRSAPHGGVAHAVAHVPAVTSEAPSGQDEGAPAADDGTVIITSPFVGTFYESPNPGAPAFVKVGQAVSRGHTLCIVEAMKLMNEIEADIDCTVTEVLAKNAQPVEYGQALYRVKPA